MRHLAVILVVLMIALSGCVGDSLDDDRDDLEDDSATDGDATSPGDTADGEDPDDPTSGPDDEDERDRPPPDDLRIHHIDVGQADATLVRTPENETILVDTGHWEDDGERVIEYLEAHDIDGIDHLVATHGHADHIGGHAAVIEWAETQGTGIGAAYDSGVPHTTRTYENYLDAIDAHDVELFTVQSGDELPLDDAYVEASVLNPPEDPDGEDLDDNSVAMRIALGDVSYLLTGDAGTETEGRLAEAGDIDADVLQVGHHGSTTSSSNAFLEAVDPDVAIISSARDSEYGHPHDEILDRLAGLDIETYWTGVHGDVVVRTDGEEMQVSTRESFSSDPSDLLAAKHGEETLDEEEDRTDSEATGDAPDALEVVDIHADADGPEDEHIVLANRGEEALDLGGWQLRDREDGGQVDRGLDPFVFPSDFELAPGEQVTIWTGEGEDTATELYWGYGVQMWRADGDVITVMNEEGEVVLAHSYGDQT